MTDSTQNTADKRPTVLYIEDNEMNLYLMQQVFAKQTNMTLRSANNAETGIEMARAEPPDLVLMDINLPGMNGHEALALLRADPRTAHIPVIAVSANAMKGDEEHGLQSGFTKYVTKPIDIPALLASVNQAIGMAARPNSQ